MGEVIKILGRQFPGTSLREARVAAEQWAQKNIRGPVVNDGTGWSIEAFLPGL